MMEPEDHIALNEFALRIRGIYPHALIWAFGSRVRGGWQWDSDLDVCVVLDECTPEIRAQVSEIAWDVGFERDILVSTVVFSREMFERGPASASPLVHTILREGIAA